MPADPSRVSKEICYEGCLPIAGSSSAQTSMKLTTQELICDPSSISENNMSSRLASRAYRLCAIATSVLGAQFVFGALTQSLALDNLAEGCIGQPAITIDGSFINFRYVNQCGFEVKFSFDIDGPKGEHDTRHLSASPCGGHATWQYWKEWRISNLQTSYIDNGRICGSMGKIPAGTDSNSTDSEKLRKRNEDMATLTRALDDARKGSDGFVQESRKMHDDMEAKHNKQISDIAAKYNKEAQEIADKRAREAEETEQEIADRMAHEAEENARQIRETMPSRPSFDLSICDRMNTFQTDGTTVHQCFTRQFRSRGFQTTPNGMCDPNTRKIMDGAVYLYCVM